MGYKIWRKDSSGWELLFETIFPTREKVDERIEELNAAYYQMVRIGEIQFFPYRDDIKLAKNGSVIDTVTKIRRKKHNRRKNKNNNSHVIITKKR